MKKLKEETKTTIMVIGASLLGTIPLIAMLFIYVDDPNSPFLNSIYEIAKTYPEISLPRNPILSESMSFYLKTIPFQILIFTFFYYKKLGEIYKTMPIVKMIYVFLGLGLICFGSLYVFLFCNIQLTQTRGFIPLLYTNDYLLTVYFIFIFIYLYFFTSVYIGYIYKFLCHLINVFIKK